MTIAFLICASIAACLLAWRTIADEVGDWASPEWRNRQTAAKYDARFRARYPE